MVGGLGSCEDAFLDKGIEKAMIANCPRLQNVQPIIII